MKICFAIPSTRLVQVEYRRDGVKYGATIPNPQTFDRLLCAMLPRKVGASMIQNVLPVNEIKRN